MPGGAAKEGLEANEEDVEVEGLGEVIVRAGFDAFENLFRARAGGEHEYGSITLGFAESPDDGEAVDSREHAVEDNGGDTFFRVEEIGERGVAIGLVVGAVALGLKIEEETLGEVFFIFDEDD